MAKLLLLELERGQVVTKMSITLPDPHRGLSQPSLFLPESVEKDYTTRALRTQRLWVVINTLVPYLFKCTTCNLQEARSSSMTAHLLQAWGSQVNGVGFEPSGPSGRFPAYLITAVYGI